jgi:hypothetical protein
MSSAAAPAQPPRRRPPAPRRELRVTACNEGFRFTSRDGRPGVIYNIGAQLADGRRVTETLRSFEELPVGELREYEIRPYRKDGQIVSYTLSLPRPTIAELARDVRELSKGIDKHTELLELQARTIHGHAHDLRKLENRLALIEQGGPIELDDSDDPAAAGDEEIPF